MAETPKTVAELEAALKQLEATRNAQLQYATSVVQRLYGQLDTADGVIAAYQRGQWRREASAFAFYSTGAASVVAWSLTHLLRVTLIIGIAAALSAAAIVSIDWGLRWAFRRWRIRRAKAVA